jgi:hypothetical protein
MFGVLVVVLCPDRVADLGFSAGEAPDTARSFFARFESRGGRHSMSTASSLQQMTLPVWVGVHS